MNKRTFEEIIEEQGKLIYTNVGDSMFPFIQPRDLLVIQKLNRPPEKYDVPLYTRESGQYVLHRIVKINGDEYYLRGDNRVFTERGIYDRHIIGVLTDIIRDGETIPLDAPRFRSYVKRLPFRYFYNRIKSCFN